MRFFKVASSVGRVVFRARFSAEDGISPGAIFREKIES